MPENAIFISYAREDLQAVQRLRAGLEAAGLAANGDTTGIERVLIAALVRRAG